MDLVYEARDGYLTAGAISTKEWVGMCRALDREDLIEDERFATPQARGQNGDERKRITAEEIAKWPTDELLERFDANGVPFGKVKTLREFAEDPQARHNRTVFDAEHPGNGTMRYVRYPGHFSETPATFRRHPPTLGQHSDEVLAEAGYGAEEISALREAGIVG